MNIREVSKNPSPETEGTSDSTERENPRINRVTSDALLAKRRELIIEHCGEEYRLRITSKGKLILTK